MYNCKINADTIVRYIEKNFDTEGFNVVDIGCGNLSITNKLIPLFKEVHGVDIEIPISNQIKVHKNNLNKQWSKLPSNHFDFVISLSTIEHLENPYHFIREIKRILKYRGFAIISTHNINNCVSKLYFMLFNQHESFFWNKNMHTNKFGKPTNVQHKTCFNKEYLTNIVKYEGLNIVDVFYGNYKLHIPKLIVVNDFFIKSKIFAKDFFVVCHK